jgi:hypothetical protein
MEPQVICLMAKRGLILIARDRTFVNMEAIDKWHWQLENEGAIMVITENLGEYVTNQQSLFLPYFFLSPFLAIEIANFGPKLTVEKEKILLFGSFC